MGIMQRITGLVGAIGMLALILPWSGGDAAAKHILYEDMTGEEMAALLRDWGHRADLKTDTDGDPRISSTIDGINFDILFYGCSNDHCSSIKFSAGFDLNDGISAAEINDWNRNRRFGRSYIDNENDPFIQFDINFEGGISIDSLRAAFATWTELLDAFKEHINF